MANRVRTVATATASPNCSRCIDVVKDAKMLNAPYILEREDIEDGAMAWAYGHLVMPSFRSIEENVLDWKEYHGLREDLEAENEKHVAEQGDAKGVKS